MLNQFKNRFFLIRNAPQYSSCLQCVGYQSVTKIKASDEVKSRWKTLRFASNQRITCFILQRNLMQIATWLASSYSTRW